jgi:hypothetical protein
MQAMVFVDNSIAIGQFSTIQASYSSLLECMSVPMKSVINTPL